MPRFLSAAASCFSLADYFFGRLFFQVTAARHIQLRKGSALSEALT
jgi:hypothetical protein